MRVYLKINSFKFHLDPIWNAGALGFFEEVTQREEEQDE